jgi:hypothetical protein
LGENFSDDAILEVILLELRSKSSHLGRRADTMFAGMPSRSGNKCAQVYATSFGWARAHPMTRKGAAHETLALLFHHDGVPLTMVLDGLKEQTKR